MKNYIISILLLPITLFAQTVFISGEDGILLKTKNLGEDWINITTKDSVYKPSFLNNILGWGTSNDKLVKTEDGGKTWQEKITNTDFPFYHVEFFNDSTGWATTDSIDILVTTDYGNHWTRKSIPGFVPRLKKFTSANNGWAVSTEKFLYFADSYSAVNKYIGKIFKTTDGGNTWLKQKVIEDIELDELTFQDDNYGVISGTDNEYHRHFFATSDGGNEWRLLDIPRDYQIISIYFIKKTGWAVGYNGEILKTTDGGITWIQKKSVKTIPLYSLCFLDENVGWAVGKNGTIIITKDGGETWEIQKSGITSDLYEVYFANNIDDPAKIKKDQSSSQIHVSKKKKNSNTNRK